MRINKYLSASSSLSRRAADSALADGRVKINGRLAQFGQDVKDDDEVTLDGIKLQPTNILQIIALNKPVGYVCSRSGQGSKTIYELLPEALRELNTIGRLDKNSSGLILLTNDGDYAQQLTHPSNRKQKVYLVELDKELEEKAEQNIKQTGVSLADGVSRFDIKPTSGDRKHWQVTMCEGRNRQIRRTFAAVNNEVKNLHRISFGKYELGEMSAGEYKKVNFL